MNLRRIFHRRLLIIPKFVPSRIVHTLIPIYKVNQVMTIRTYASVSNYEGAGTKKIKLTVDDYEDLNNLLSDSDGWDDEQNIEATTKTKDGCFRRKVRTEFSDEDDSIIYHMFDRKKPEKLNGKILAGATRKSLSELPSRASFSSHISERPLVESTQRRLSRSSICDNDDSRLLISILKGETSPRDISNKSTGEENGVVLDQPSLKMKDALKNEVEIKEKREEHIENEEGHLSSISSLDSRYQIYPKNIREENVLYHNDLQSKKSIDNLVDQVQEQTTRELPNVHENQDDICIVSERRCSGASNEDANLSPSKLSQTSRMAVVPEEHHRILKKEKVQYAEKFALLTQRPCLQDLQELEKKLKWRPNTKIVVPLRLSKEQEDVLRLAEQGYNIFYTGSAGTGKSVLLREMIKVLKHKYGNEEVAVTASTGLAACNVGGITVHSFAGVGLGHGDEKKLYQKVKRSQKFVKRWQNASALVIDEISMLDGDLLDKLDFIARKIRKNNRPFGNIQLIFCGDFFQLPPVSKDHGNPMKFAFESSVWKDAIDVTIALKKVFRQQGDTKFIEMLNKLRLGKIDNETELEFKKLSRPLPQDDIIPAELYSTRNEVDRANNSRLGRLPGKSHTYHAIDGGILQDKEMKERLLQNFLAPKQLQLKIGAQVMMIKNIDATLVNGSLGKVIDFIDHETYMFYETMRVNPDLEIGELERLKQNPDILRETWNENSEEPEGTVRQKTTKDIFCKSDPEVSECELGETIFDFLNDTSTDDSQVKANLERKAVLLREIHESSRRKRKLPLVRFKTSDMSTRTVLVEPEDWAVEDENEKPLVSRVQLPLMLAWSLSIHKSQGQTLPKVKVDLRRVFEKGQAYVALSRAVSREGLQVLNFDKSRIMAHQKVVSFYSTLVSVEEAMERLKECPAKNRISKNERSDFAPIRSFAPKRTRQTKSKSNSPNPAGIDRITQMLTRKNKTQQPKER